jgi:hypothetical protein
VADRWVRAEDPTEPVSEASMSEIQTLETDHDAVNARILAKEAKLDFRRVEAASVKMRTHLTSAEAKRLFVRTFQTLQLNAHFVSVIARTRLDHQHVASVEELLRSHIDAVKARLNEALDGAEALFKANGIGSVATYDTQPLEIEVGILSSSGRRYLEVFNQFDQLMPALQTLEIHEVISTQELDAQRAVLKRQIKGIATIARNLAGGLRKRMNAAAVAPSVRARVASDGPSGAGGVALASRTADVVQASSVDEESLKGPTEAREVMPAEPGAGDEHEGLQGLEGQAQRREGTTAVQSGEAKEVA